MRRLLRSFAISLVICISLITNAQAQSTLSSLKSQSKESQELQGFDEFVAKAMQDWKVPGTAIAIIHENDIVLMKGYGYRDIEKQLPVTPHTVFAIASISKSFTVTTLGTLVDEGKLQWDKPIREYLPGFRMYDPAATEQLTLRDMLTHRTGLPRHDSLWRTSDFSREDLIRRFQYLQPSKPFRTAFQYSNLMFMAAGYLAGKADGMTWEEAVQRRVLNPLDMKETNFSALESQKRTDYAKPYSKDFDTGEVKLVPFYIMQAVGPAGGLNSNIFDLTHYLQFHMNDGRYNGRQILSQDSERQMQTSQIVIQGNLDAKELGPRDYGMGLFISEYRGHKVVSHGGNIDGFSSTISFMPDQHVGVIVLTNLSQTFLTTVLENNVFDRLLGLDQIPWNDRILAKDRDFDRSKREAKAKGFTKGRPGTHPSHDLSEYAGDYENPGYGIASVTQDGEDFQLKLNTISVPLRHFHYDVFEVPDHPIDDFSQGLKVNFQTDMDGDIASLSMPLEPTVSEIVFTRMPDKLLLNHDFLQTLTGQYDMPAKTEPMVVTLRGDHTLIASIPGEQDTELIPTRGTRFKLAGRSGFSIEFKKDASGHITEAAYNRGDAILTLKKK